MSYVSSLCSSGGISVFVVAFIDRPPSDGGLQNQMFSKKTRVCEAENKGGHKRYYESEVLNTFAFFVCLFV